MGAGTTFAPAVHASYDTPWERRDVLGVHPQKQEGLSWVGASVPSGRLQADDLEVRGGGLAWYHVVRGTTCTACCCSALLSKPKQGYYMLLYVVAPAWLAVF